MYLLKKNCILGILKNIAVYCIILTLNLFITVTSTDFIMYKLSFVIITLRHTLSFSLCLY